MKAQPRALWILVGYSLLTATWSGLLVALHWPDPLLLPLIVPIVAAALFYPRRIYLSMTVLALIASVGVTYQLSWSFETSLQVISLTALSALVIAELVHALVMRRRRAEEAYATLAQASLHLTAELEPQATLEAVVDYAQAVLGADRVALYLLDPETETLSCAYVRGLSDEYVTAVNRFYRSIPGWRAVSGEPVWVEDAQATGVMGPLEELARREGYRTLAVMPLRWGATLFGALTLYFDQPRPRDQGLLDLAQPFVNQAAVAMKNAQLFDRLRTTEAQYRGLFEGNRDPIVVMDADGTILDANSAAQRLMHEERQDWGGQSALAFTPVRETMVAAEARYRVNGEMDRPTEMAVDLSEAPFRRGIQRVLTGEMIQPEISLPVSGEMRAFEARVECVDYAGRPALQWTAHDVTARRELDRWREELTAIIVHNLRNPLSWVQSGVGLAQMVLPSETDPDASMGLEKAMQGVVRLDQQIDVLLNINRAESGQELSDQKALDLAELVVEVVELMRPRAESRGITLHTELPAGLLEVVGNRNMLAWALENLMHNAVKFSPAGKPVYVQVERTGEQICFAVRDQGPGIDPAEQARIFDKFYRADSSLNSKGVGLGLYFVRLATKAHHGSIQVKSQPGEGCTFVLCLPVAQEDKAACHKIVEG